MRVLSIFVCGAMTINAAAFLFFFDVNFTGTIHSFDEPIDAISVGVDTDDIDLRVSARINGTWTAMQTLEIEKEFDPLLRESNLVMFPEPVTQVRITGTTHTYDLHPVRVSAEPAHVEYAATNAVPAPRILSRRQWGADESLRYVQAGSDSSRSDVNPPSEPADVPQRVIDCQNAQRDYPEEFEVAQTIREESGKRLRWPIQTSPSIKLLVVHHTALEVHNDNRPAIERVRALYSYHANNRGWGDVGYNFIIDENGQIYEGRAGGANAVGGHAYCNNVGSIGISLMGNFEKEKPSQKQMQSLQWLMNDLADDYDIDLNRSVKFHGKQLTSPIVTHGSLVSTACPGFYVRSVMAQVRNNVQQGNLYASITFPQIRSTATARTTREERIAERIQTYESTTTKAISRRTQSRLLYEVDPRTRRVIGNSVPRTSRAEDLQRQRSTSALSRRVTVDRRTITTSAPRSTVSSTSAENPIRIRLTLNGNPRLQFANGGSASLTRSGGSCEATIGNTKRTGAPLQFAEDEFGLVSVTDNSRTRTYRGIVECRVIDGELVLINELGLEDYMRGLSEEPDTEPYEKQRAFAIAARTYALWYTDPANRKFPGMPYDGSDSPAQFQAYVGVTFENANPSWLRAVADTSKEVLTYNQHLIKPPYYSSNDGRTRSPSEVGWPNFPFAEVFASKSDPWCSGMENRGHGVGMSGCGAEAQAHEGKTAEQILKYYYTGVEIEKR